VTAKEEAGVLDLAVLAPGPERLGRGVLRRFAADRAAVVGGVMLLGMVLAVAAAPWLSPFDPTAIDPAHALAPPSSEHPFGTDLLGRDMLSRILHGGRTSMSTAFAAVAGISLIGFALGTWAGTVGGVVDTLIMRVVDTFQALPLLIVAMVAVGFLGGGADKLVLTVALLGWTGYARVVRAATLSIREREFVDAARAQGASVPWIMRRHIAPNLLGVATALSTVDLGRIVLVLAGLSFLGFGVTPPDPEWGAMLADARTSFFLAPQLLWYPGLAISLLVLAVNLCGDGLRDAVDGKVVEA
jgi:ABC-type dipeptide/oligopeptide/nickel transport system permease subunit